MSAAVSADVVTVNILLVEDNPGDVGLISQAIKRLSRPTSVRAAKNAEQAMEFLGIGHGHEQAFWPDVIFLDLNLPGIKGLELLECLRKESRFARTRILILTSSNAPDDVRRAQELGAQDYLTKPSTFRGLVELLQRAIEQWKPTAMGRRAS